MSRLIALLAATLVLAVVPALPAVAQEASASWFVAPHSAGDGSGREAQNAAALTELNAVVSGAEPGDEVILLADRGVYSPSGQVTLSGGGSADALVTIRGGLADGSPAPATFVSNRAQPWTPGGKHGKNILRLNAGANHLALQDLAFTDVGTAIHIAADIRGLHLSRLQGTNVRRFLNTHAGGGSPTASLISSTITDVTVRGFSKSVIRLRYDSRDILIERVFADSERQDGDAFAMGVHMSGTTHDVTLRHVAMHNSHDTTNEYWNGDGFAAERGTHDLTFESTSAMGSTDAGYDLKSTGTVLIGADAADNKRNFRLWADATVVACVAEHPNHRGGTGGPNNLWVAEDAVVEVYGCSFSDGDNWLAQVPSSADVSVEPTIPARFDADLARLGLDTGTGGDQPAGPPDDTGDPGTNADPGTDDDPQGPTPPQLPGGSDPTEPDPTTTATPDSDGSADQANRDGDEPGTPGSESEITHFVRSG